MILSFMLQSHSSSREIQQGDGPEREKSVYFPLCMSACVFGDNSWLISPFKRPHGTQSVNKQRPAKLLLHSFFAPASLLKEKKPLFPWLITPHHLPPSHPTPYLSATLLASFTPTQVEDYNTLRNLKFTIIASPDVTKKSESWEPSLFNLSNILSAWSLVGRKRLWGLFNHDPNSPLCVSPALASWLKDRFLHYLSGVGGCRERGGQS